MLHRIGARAGERATGIEQRGCGEKPFPKLLFFQRWQIEFTSAMWKRWEERTIFNHLRLRFLAQEALLGHQGCAQTPGIELCVGTEV